MSVQKDELDKVIEKHLKQLAHQSDLKMDLVILRIAIFEMTYVTDVPAAVALNEAIELAKHLVMTVHVNSSTVFYQCIERIRSWGVSPSFFYESS